MDARPLTIDLNADLGEGGGDDAGLMAVISSCNIACGGHAGDDASMAEALSLARQHGVAAGAHPSFPDREGFGRRAMDLPPGELADTLRRQVGALKAMADEAGVPLTHVKPHGALYNEAARHRGLADVVVHMAKECLPGSFIVGPPEGELRVAASKAGVSYAAEGFADRAYTEAGELVPRSTPGAIIESDMGRLGQALALARGEGLTSLTGQPLALQAQTICVHGDSPGALASAKAIRAALEEAGFRIEPVHG